MKKYSKYLRSILILFIVLAAVFFLFKSKIIPPKVQNQKFPLPIFIESLKKRNYPASEIVIEQTLPKRSNYLRYIASYHSDGLKIYGLLTIPDTPRPDKGYPAILFLHGYVNPETYVTTGNYAESRDGLAKNGFITFKPDFRGHGKSEGSPQISHFSEGYLVDSLNALSALKIYPAVDPGRIGVWGHSNGGGLALRMLVITKNIKAVVIWSGVVGTYQDLLETYRTKVPWLPLMDDPALVKNRGLPSTNPEFWNKLDAYNYLKDITAPIQLHHGTADEEVPIEFSIHLKNELEKAGKTVEFYQYPGDKHNLSGANFYTAIQRSIDFFKNNL